MTLIYLTKNIDNLIIPLKINPVASFVFLRPYAILKAPFNLFWTAVVQNKVLMGISRLKFFKGI